MIIDAHVHILPDRVRDNPKTVAAHDPWFARCHAGGARMLSAESLVERLDARGIDAAICFSWPFADAALCAGANDYVAAAQRRFPGRIIGFGIVSPGDPGAPAEIERCARIGLRGIGELNAGAQGFTLTDQARLQPVVDAALRCELPWNLHCSEPVGHEYAGKGTATPNLVANFAQRNPELTLICSHLGGGLPLYAHMPEVRALCSRLWFDTAAQPFVYAASVYRALIDMVGYERILFGSDYPLLDMPRYQAAMQAASLTEMEMGAILGGNAGRLFGGQ